VTGPISAENTSSFHSHLTLQFKTQQPADLSVLSKVDDFATFKKVEVV